MKILLVEDNQTIIKGLEYAFQSNGYEVCAVKTVRETKQYLAKQSPDLIVLDISLPDGNGMRLFENEICQRKIPTIFLTAVDDEDVVVKGLNLGADDYITKPFSTKELMARVNRVLLRNRREMAVQVGDVTFDMDKMIVTKAENVVNLTSLEMKILQLLFLNLDKVVSRSTILDKIWEWTGNDVDDHTVTVYFKRIREKIGSEVIVTVKGIGYRIDKDGK